MELPRIKITSQQSSEVGALAPHDLSGLTVRFIGVVGGVVCLACFSLLLFWLHLRRRSGGAPPYAADRALSHRTLSTRSRGSYYPPSVPVHGHEFETNKTGWHIPEVIPEVYVRFFSCSFSPTTYRSTLFVYRVDRPSHPKSLYTARPSLTCRQPTIPPSTGAGENVARALLSSLPPSYLQATRFTASSCDSRFLSHPHYTCCAY